MEQLLFAPGGGLPREPSGTLFVPVRTRSTCSGDVATETSSTSYEADELEEQQSNSRRITLCKQVLLEATTKFNAAPLIDSPLFKGAACRNSGALLPLLSMLAAEQEPAPMVRCLDTLSFLLLDRANRRACHELRALDVILNILRRSTDQQVLHSALEALSCLCKHDAKDKMALWNHPNKGALLSMLSSRHSSAIVVETLRTCRVLCFALGPSSDPAVTGAGVTTASGTGTSSSSVEPRGAAMCPAAPAIAQPHSRHQQHPECPQHGPAHHHQHLHQHGSQHHQYGSLQLLEPALLTVASELLHPSTDVSVLHKALKLLHSASAVANCGISGQGCYSGQGYWHNAVFRIVPLLTHCGDLEVVESALAVLVNLSEHDVFHNMFFASGCIPPLLHLLSHKRCAVSQSASCVLSALSEGGLSRDKLCQDTALLAMLRVLQTNHCVVVTLGVLYMLGRLAAYRSQVVRSLKGWGAIPLLMRLMATTQDEDAAEGCRQLLQTLGIKPPLVALTMNPAGTGQAGHGPTQQQKISLHVAHSSIAVFGAGGAPAPMPITGMESGNGALCRTISAAATVAAMAAEVAEAQQSMTAVSSGVEATAPLRGSTGATAAGSKNLGRFNHHSSFRYFGGPGGALCAPMGPIAAAVPPAAAY